MNMFRAPLQRGTRKAHHSALEQFRLELCLKQIMKIDCCEVVAMDPGRMALGDCFDFEIEYDIDTSTCFGR